MNVLPILVRTKQGLYPFDRLFPIKLGPCENVAVSYITVDIKRMSIHASSLLFFAQCKGQRPLGLIWAHCPIFMAALFQLRTSMYNDTCVQTCI